MIECAEGVGGGKGVRFEAGFLPDRIWGFGTRHFFLLFGEFIFAVKDE